MKNNSSAFLVSPLIGLALFYCSLLHAETLDLQPIGSYENSGGCEVKNLKGEPIFYSGADGKTPMVKIDNKFVDFELVSHDDKGKQITDKFKAKNYFLVLNYKMLKELDAGAFFKVEVRVEKGKTKRTLVNLDGHCGE